MKAVIQVSVSNPKEFEELFSISSKSGSEPAKPPKSLRDRLIEEVTKEKKPLEKKCEQDTRVCISSNERKVSVEFSVKCEEHGSHVFDGWRRIDETGHVSVSFSTDLGPPDTRPDSDVVQKEGTNRLH